MILQIKNGLVVDPTQNLQTVQDVWIKDGVIVSPQSHADETVDATGLAVLPGLVDMHVHLRDPGQTHKEDILSGCGAAAAGGVTSLLCMPNTTPPIDSEEIIEQIKNKSKDAKARVYLTATISKGMQGEALSDFALYRRLGVTAVSDDGRPVRSAPLMAKAVREAKAQELVVTSHCEDLELIDGGIIHDGSVAKELGVKGMTRASEDTVTAREILLAETYDCPVHIAHVSTKTSVALIRDAKGRGVAVTAETCPHYTAMTHEMLRTRDADYRMNPPLREEADRLAIIEGLRDGTLDCITTDHAPHTPQEKADFEKAPNGVVGLETSFAAAYTHLVKTGQLSLLQLVEKMSTNPASILKIPAGSLQIGANADVILVDLDKQWTVQPERFASKGRNSAFKHKTLTGKVVRTYLQGQEVYRYQEEE